MSHYTPSEIRTIRQNLDKSDREIAKLIGRSRTSVTLIRKRIGIEKKPVSSANGNAMCLAQKIIIIESNLSAVKLAPKIGLHPTTIQKFRAK